MDFLNRIELKGIVGRASLASFGGHTVASITLVTEYLFVDKDGHPVIETTWHRVGVWDTCTELPLNEINKGDKLHVTGRIRSMRYTDTDGNDRTTYEIVASSLERIDE